MKDVKIFIKPDHDNRGWNTTHTIHELYKTNAGAWLKKRLFIRLDSGSTNLHHI